MTAPRELGPGSVRDVPPPEPAALRAYTLTASVMLIRVDSMGLDGGGGMTVEKIMPGRDGEGAPTSGRASRTVALVREGHPRTELQPPDALRGFDGRRVSGKLLHVCRVVSVLPRDLLLDLVLEDRASPLHEMGAMDADEAADFYKQVSARAGSGEGLRTLHKWRALLAEFRSERGSQPTLAREPWLPLAGWDGANGRTAVKRDRTERVFYRLDSGEWEAAPGRGARGVGAPASCVEKLLSLLPHDVIVDLHETYPGDPLREVLAMGQGKAAAFVEFLSAGFEQVKTMFTWMKAMRHFEAYWEQGNCYSTNVEAGGGWVATAIEQLYRGGTGREHVSVWASNLRAAFARASGSSVTAADVAEFAASPEVLRDSRVESVELSASGQVRVVLKEPIYARIIKQGGRTWREADALVGSVMKQYPIAAFDLLYDGLGAFPNARAYADKDCRQHARHANIGSAGTVCMGDLSYRNEDAGRSTLNDFLRMLVVWNLDSAHYSDPGYLMQNPAPLTGGASLWAAVQPGLIEIQMGFRAMPIVATDGPGMGTVELVLD